MAAKQSKIFIYGKHAVAEAISHAPHAVKRIHLSKAMDDSKLRQLIKSSGIPVEPLDERKATSQAEGGASHQGVIAQISLFDIVIPFERFIETFTPSPESPLVFLSEIQDPHNVGGIIRSAAGFSANAVLVPTHKQAGISGSVIKASAGMAFRVPLVEVSNPQQAIAALKKKGVRVFGLDGTGKKNLSDVLFNQPTMLVLGNESEGIAPYARALCDEILSIRMDPRCESLNVAAAAAVALYAWSARHPDAVGKAR